MSKHPSLMDQLKLIEELHDHAASNALHYASAHPDPGWHAYWAGRARTFAATAALLRILATFEDRARKFVAGLVAEHRG